MSKAITSLVPQPTCCCCWTFSVRWGPCLSHYTLRKCTTGIEGWNHTIRNNVAFHSWIPAALHLPARGNEMLELAAFSRLHYNGWDGRALQCNAIRGKAIQCNAIQGNAMYYNCRDCRACLTACSPWPTIHNSQGFATLCATGMAKRGIAGKSRAKHSRE